MYDTQMKRLAEIVLTQRLIICSVQRTLRHVYEEATKGTQTEELKGITAEFDRLEGILHQIETQDDPRDRALFGLD